MRHIGHSCDIDKSPVTAVAIEHISRVAGCPRAIGHVDIEKAVVVVIGPRRAEARPQIADAGLRRLVCEMPVAAIGKEHVGTAAKPAVARDIEIGITVIVVIGYLCTNTSHRQ